MGRKKTTAPFTLKSGNNVDFKSMGSSPMKQDTTTTSLRGVNIDPMAHKRLDKSKIPSFRDFISLEQQQAYADKVDAKRAKKKEMKEWEEKKKTGAHTLEKEDIDLSKKEAPEPVVDEVTVEDPEINVGSNSNSYIY